MSDTSRNEQRALLRKVEELVTQIDRTHDEPVPIHAMVDAIIEELREDLGIFGGRLYERSGDDYFLKVTFPGAVPVDQVFRISDRYPPIEMCLLNGTVYMAADDPAVDPEIEAALGVTEFAAVEVGSERYVIGFDVAPGHNREDILFSLGVLRHAVNQKIRQENVESIFRQAKQIQASILPTAAPEFGGYDIAGRSDALDSVGGDLFDFLPITDKIMGLAIADASGHGFPAALQVRDIYMGLRMGMARDLKIVRTVERLNQIIHTSTLTSRFVSMFYGELEANGLFIYVNAGHPAPFHVAANGTVTDLAEGGPILGPLARATYDRGVVKMRPGDMLVLYTDGLTEATRVPAGAADGPDEHGEEFGVERLRQVALRHQGETARFVVDAIFDAVHDWNGVAADDDRTVIVVTFPS
ncbi:MAG: PP2C family protein-serine/threonine phosphatase [Thermoanaerobaculia bacterium]|nr:PP2C family protein-serine/threonine phosphatase [Thermoanaerobaculia bacterium]